MAILARLNVNGQGLSVAEKHRPLRPTIDASPLKRATTTESKIAMTFRGGTHDLWVRYWLAAGGVNPETAPATLGIPPAQMVANLKAGTQDAFCVGEPWGGQTVNQRVGYTACLTSEIWMNHP